MNMERVISAKVEDKMINMQKKVNTQTRALKSMLKVQEIEFAIEDVVTDGKFRESIIFDGSEANRGDLRKTQQDALKNAYLQFGIEPHTQALDFPVGREREELLVLKLPELHTSFRDEDKTSTRNITPVNAADQASRDAEKKLIDRSVLEPLRTNILEPPNMPTERYADRSRSVADQRHFSHMRKRNSEV